MGTLTPGWQGTPALSSWCQGIFFTFFLEGGFFFCLDKTFVFLGHPSPVILVPGHFFYFFFGGSFFFVWTKLSFCFGGLITLFQLFHTPCKVHKLPSHQRNSKKGFVCAHFSLHDPLSLSLSPVKVKVFQISIFYNISALIYLPRARTSVPRLFQGTLLHCFTLQQGLLSRLIGWW